MDEAARFAGWPLDARARRRTLRVGLELAALAVLVAWWWAPDRTGPRPPREAVPADGRVPRAAAVPAAASMGGRIPLPTDQHYVAPGLVAHVVAAGHVGLRQIAFAPDGDLWGQRADGTLVRMRDVDGDGVYRGGSGEVVEWATSGGNGHGVHLDAESGWLYAGSPQGVRRWRWAHEVDAGGLGEDVLVGQPEEGHGKHTAHLWDGFLYVQSGSAGNATHETLPEDGRAPGYDTVRSLVKRFELARKPADAPFDWRRDGEVWTVGLRNTVGFARDRHGRIWGVVNGLDEVTYRGVDVHQDNPGEPIVLLEAGVAYGYPFCFNAQRIATAAGAVLRAGTSVVNEGFPSPYDDAWCAAHAREPQTFVQAHSAPLAIAFLEPPSAALPERWRGGAFVALHGSWNRERSTGYKVVWIPFDEHGWPTPPVSDADGTRFPYEVVLGGGRAGVHRDGAWRWSSDVLGEGPVRPAGVAVSPSDGALYVSTDAGGYVYRIALEGR